MFITFLYVSKYIFDAILAKWILDTIIKLVNKSKNNWPTFIEFKWKNENVKNLIKYQKQMHKWHRVCRF